MIHSIAAGSFKTSGAFPPLLVKSIDVQSTPHSEGLKFKMDILIQAPRAEEDPSPFGILVVAVVQGDFLNLLKSNRTRIAGLIKMVKNRNDVTSINGLGYAKLLTYSGINETDGGSVAYSKEGAPLAQNSLINVDFELAEVPTNLSMLVVPYGINAAADAPAGASHGVSDDDRIILGNPLIETILQNKFMNPSARIFRLLENSKFGKAGELWVGPVHRHPKKGLMAGSGHTAEPHPRVETTLVGNQKIKDGHLADAIAKLPMAATWERPLRRSHFGQVAYSRSFNNEIGIMIPFDVQSYIKENFAFGKLIRNTASLLSCAKIEDIKVFRTRVQENNLGSKLTPVKNGACNDCYKIPPTLIGTLKNGQVKLLDLQLPNQMVHHIFVKDTYMADTEQSHFEYSVEIDMLDDTPAALSSLLHRLDTALYDYEAYLAALQNDGHMPENYQTFINANAESLSARKDWKALIVEFLSVMSFIYGLQATTYRTGIAWALKMLPFANPYSASIESALELKEIIQNYRRRLGEVYGKTSVQKSEAPLNVNQRIGQVSSSKRRLKILHTIKETYYNELSPGVGFNYLGEDISVGASFDKIAHQQYIQRVNIEMDKYNLTNPSSQGVNKYGFLSPRVISTSTQDLVTSREMSLVDSYDLYQANLLPSTTEKNFLANPANFDNETSLANKILNYEGLTYNRLNKPISQVAAEYVSPPTENKDASVYFGEDSSFVFDSKSEETETYGSDIPAYIRSLKKSVDLVKNPIIRITLDDIITSSRTPRLTDIEKINGSFAHRQLSLDENSLTAMNLFEIEINFNSVVKIEYCAGYNNSLMDPVWLTLTPAQVTSLNNGERSTFLCRIADMGSVFSQPNIFKLSSFNQYFILGSDPGTNAMALQSTYDNRYKVIRSSIKALMSKPMVNTNTAEAAIFPQYTLSSAMIYEPTLGESNEYASESSGKTASSNQRTGGSY